MGRPFQGAQSRVDCQLALLPVRSKVVVDTESIEKKLALSQLPKQPGPGRTLGVRSRLLDREVGAVKVAGGTDARRLISFRGRQR